MWCDGLSLEEWESKHEEDEIYLHGLCHEWVLENALHNDKYILITEIRENKICIMHCCILRNEKYIDVRGETSNFDDILDAFDYGEFNILIYNDINDFVDKVECILCKKINMWYI